MRTIVVALALMTCPFIAKADDMRDLAAVALRAALEKRNGLYDLGTWYYAGRVVKRDYAKAAFLWKKASDRGSIAAKNNLGYLYFEGLGVERNSTQAVALWQEAAEKGHGEAQLHLGNAIFHGEGAAKSEVLGIAWVMCAIQNSKTKPFEPEVGGGPVILAFAEKELASMSGSVAEPLVISAKQMTEKLPACGK